MRYFKAVAVGTSLELTKLRHKIGMNQLFTEKELEKLGLKVSKDIHRIKIVTYSYNDEPEETILVSCIINKNDIRLSGGRRFTKWYRDRE